MILISGSPLMFSEFADEYPKTSVEHQLLEQMSKSATAYSYDTPEQLRFELSLRNEIVAAARALHRSGLRFAVFHKSACNPAYWDRTGNGGFQLKDGVKPSDAMKDIFINGNQYATECATAMVIVYYGALLRALPGETFDRLFPSIYLMNWHRLDPLLKETGIPRNVAEILPGDRCYFKNPEVDPKIPELQGENVIVLLDNLYYGHGIGITSAERIIYMLNANRKEGATESAHFMEGSAARPNFKALAEASKTPAPQPAVLRWAPFPRPILG